MSIKYQQAQQDYARHVAHKGEEGAREYLIARSLEAHNPSHQSLEVVEEIVDATIVAYLCDDTTFLESLFE